MGIQIAIDDFGTGFSSLAYLHRLPIDRLKIDRAFVRDLGTTRASGASIAQTVISLGRSLGLSDHRRGIETDEQAQLLMNLGCPLAGLPSHGRSIPPHSSPGGRPPARLILLTEQSFKSSRGSDAALLSFSPVSA